MGKGWIRAVPKSRADTPGRAKLARLLINASERADPHGSVTNNFGSVRVALTSRARMPTNTRAGGAVVWGRRTRDDGPRGRFGPGWPDFFFSFPLFLFYFKYPNQIQSLVLNSRFQTSNKSLHELYFYCLQ
jgi:hypothetical protein